MKPELVAVMGVPTGPLPGLVESPAAWVSRTKPPVVSRTPTSNDKNPMEIAREVFWIDLTHP